MTSPDASAPTGAGSSSGPLAGIRVLALEQAVAGPLCTRHLADLGADVIKVERPGGGDFARRYDRAVLGLSSYFVWLNRGKRSLTLDMKHPSATGVLERLIGEADVFVQNLGPGAIDRVGFAPPNLRTRFPRLVVCSISGYGRGGPYEHKKAFDLLLQGETGVIATTGTADNPAKLGISVGDIGAGVYGAMATLAALFERQTTGQGKIVETSLFDALAEWMGYPVPYTRYSGEAPARAGVRHATVIPYGIYRCGDGGGVNFSVQTDGHWERFCRDVCERPDWLDDARFSTPSDRLAHREELETAIEVAFGHHPRDEISRRLEAADIPSADYREVAEFLDHPQLAARNRWAEFPSPAGPITMIVPPFDLEGMSPRLGAVPDVGEHTDEVLSEIGYAPAEIAALRASGAV